jgi:hypothetical protein
VEDYHHIASAGSAAEDCASQQTFESPARPRRARLTAS